MASSDSADERVFTDEALGFELFWQKHKLAILWSLAGVLLAALLAIGWLIHHHSRRLASEAALMAASSIEEFRKVANDFSGYPAGRTAQVLLAVALAKAGDRQAAMSEYQIFLDKYATSPLAGPARLALATIALADGQQKRGMGELNAAAESSDPFTAQMGLFFKGRELIASGDFAAARNALQLLSATYGSSPAGRISRGLFQQIAAVEASQDVAADQGTSSSFQIPTAAPSPN